MDKLLLIMNSMNDQISKLADAVKGNGSAQSSTFNSSSDEVEERNYKAFHGVHGHGHRNGRRPQSEDELDNTVIEKREVRRAPNPNDYLRKDLRDYLLAKVLTVE